MQKGGEMDGAILSDFIPALKSRFYVLALNQGSYFFVNHTFPTGIEDFAEIDFKDNGSVRLISKANLILVVEKIHPSFKGAKYLKFVRFERNVSERHKLRFAEPKSFPKLQSILLETNERLYNSVGGLDNAVIYEDEILVPNEPAFGWIINRSEANNYLPEEKNIVYFFVEHTKRGTARVVDETDAFEKVVDSKLPRTRVQGVFKVGVNSLTKRVVEIVNLKTMQNIEKVIVVSQFPPKYATVGEILSF